MDERFAQQMVYATTQDACVPQSINLLRTNGTRNMPDFSATPSQ